MIFEEPPTIEGRIRHEQLARIRAGLRETNFFLKCQARLIAEGVLMIRRRYRGAVKSAFLTGV